MLDDSEGDDSQGDDRSPCKADEEVSAGVAAIKFAARTGERNAAWRHPHGGQQHFCVCSLPPQRMEGRLLLSLLHVIVIYMCSDVYTFDDHHRTHSPPPHLLQEVHLLQIVLTLRR